MNIYSYDDGFAYIVAETPEDALEEIKKERVSYYEGGVEFEREDDNKYTWDDLYSLAMYTGFGNEWLSAKDFARYSIVQLCIRETGEDIEEEWDCPEDGIDAFLETYSKIVYFDCTGSISCMEERP